VTNSPRVGTVGQEHFTVEAKHAIDFADEQMPAVLCTPWLIWFLNMPHAPR
jgi:predicted thioesterase